MARKLFPEMICRRNCRLSSASQVQQHAISEKQSFISALTFTLVVIGSISIAQAASAVPVKSPPHVSVTVASLSMWQCLAIAIAIVWAFLASKPLRHDWFRNQHSPSFLMCCGPIVLIRECCLGRDRREKGGLLGPNTETLAGLLQKLHKLFTIRQPVDQAPTPPEIIIEMMQCLICMDFGMSNGGVVCLNGHFIHRACLDQLATHICNEYLTQGPSKSSFIPCPYNNNRCCLFTSEQLRRGGGGASASCIVLLDRVETADAKLRKLPVLEQLRCTNQDAYMCPKCNFGPVAHFACPNLGGAPQTNRCPRCSFFAANIGGWRKWDGKFA